MNSGVPLEVLECVFGPRQAGVCFRLCLVSDVRAGRAVGLATGAGQRPDRVSLGIPPARGAGQPAYVQRRYLFATARIPLAGQRCGRDAQRDRQAGVIQGRVRGRAQRLCRFHCRSRRERALREGDDIVVGLYGRVGEGGRVRASGSAGRGTGLADSGRSLQALRGCTDCHQES